MKTNQNNPPKFWQELNDIINKKSASSKIDLEDANGNQLDPSCATGSKLAAKFRNSSNILQPEEDRRDQLPRFDLVPVTQSALLDEIKKINIYFFSLKGLKW